MGHTARHRIVDLPIRDGVTALAGFALRVKRRTPGPRNPNQPLVPTIKETRPYLEGVKIEGRYAVVYSKYDISCALERQASVACEGYIEEDAFKIAVNIILYAMMQDVRYYPLVK